jgi:hypothetical protein
VIGTSRFEIEVDERPPLWSHRRNWTDLAVGETDFAA